MRDLLDQLYWVRAAMGAILGVLSPLLGFEALPGRASAHIFLSPGFFIALGVYVLTVIIFRRLYIGRVSRDKRNRLITSGIGAYFMLWLFIWVLIQTLRYSGLPSL